MLNIPELPPVTLKLPHITNTSSLVDCAKNVSLQKKPYEGDTGCLTQRRSVTLSTSVYCIICATVLPLQKAGAYKTAINVNWEFIHGSCTCVAACNHTAALM